MLETEEKREPTWYHKAGCLRILPVLLLTVTWSLPKHLFPHPHCSQVQALCSLQPFLSDQAKKRAPSSSWTPVLWLHSSPSLCTGVSRGTTLSIFLLLYCQCTARESVSPYLYKCRKTNSENKSSRKEDSKYLTLHILKRQGFFSSILLLSGKGSRENYRFLNHFDFWQ